MLFVDASLEKQQGTFAADAGNLKTSCREFPLAQQAKAARKRALDRAVSIASSDQVSEKDVKHVLIAGLLEEELGAGLAGDPRFQEVVRDVVRVISSDDHSRAVFDRAIAQLKLHNAGL